MLDDEGFVNLEKVCRECQAPYVISVQEQQRSDEAGWSLSPRCRACRAKSRERRNALLRP